MTVFPNPANNELTVQFTDNSLNTAAWTLSDLYGRELLHGNLNPDKISESINLQTLPSGIYIFVAGGFSSKIVVQH